MPYRRRGDEGDRVLAHPGRDEIRLEAVLHALADPLRLQVVRALAATDQELSCADIGLAVS